MFHHIWGTVTLIMGTGTHLPVLEILTKNLLFGAFQHKKATQKFPMHMILPRGYSLIKIFLLF